jgi:hypothetical protein
MFDGLSCSFISVMTDKDVNEHERPSNITLINKHERPSNITPINEHERSFRHYTYTLIQVNA